MTFVIRFVVIVGLAALVWKLYTLEPTLGASVGALVLFGIYVWKTHG